MQLNQILSIMVQFLQALLYMKISWLIKQEFTNIYQVKH